MAGVNRCTLLGHIGRDPETKTLDSGTTICTFSIATTEKWKNKESGEWEEKTEWHNIVAFNKLAEICGEYLHKGKQVYIEGKIQTRSWEKDGEKKYKTEIVCNEMQMLGSKNDTVAGKSEENWTSLPDSQPELQGTEQGTQHDEDDSVPF